LDGSVIGLHELGHRLKNIGGQLPGELEAVGTFRTAYPIQLEKGVLCSTRARTRN
jgi:hypothetical protein